jgi:polyvinyl alcohol dehydrogenase (cytochrome)
MLFKHGLSFLFPKSRSKLPLEVMFRARAAVVNGVVYFPDWGGNIWAVNANNGHLVWGHQLSDYGLAAGTVSRTSPAVVDGIVYIGTQYNSFGPTGWLLAVNAGNGNLMWKTQPITSNPSP